MVDEKEVLKAFISRMTDGVVDLKAEGKSNEYISAWASGYIEGARDLSDEIIGLINSVNEDSMDSTEVFIEALKGLSN